MLKEYLSSLWRPNRVSNVNCLITTVPRQIVEQLNLKAGDKLIWRVTENKIEIDKW